MTTLVTGASGFIGRHVVAALAERGDAVRALVRDPAAAAFPAGVEVAAADVRDAAALGRAAAGCERVVHLAGGYRGRPRDLVAAHVGGTANLLAALPDGARVLLVSSTSVYGVEQDWPADEATPPRPVTAYGTAKAHAERAVLAWRRGTGLVVRPTITYGPGDLAGMVPRAWRLLRRGRLLLPGSGRNRVHLAYVDDVVAGLLAALDRGTGTYVLAGPEPDPISRVLQVLAALADAPRPRFVGGRRTARLAALTLESLWGVAPDREPPVGAHSVDVLTRDRAFSTTRARTDLDWQPTTTLGEGLVHATAWLSEHAPARPSGQRPSPSGGGPTPAEVPGPPWRPYLEDPDEGLGTVYERFLLGDVIDRALTLTGSASILHAPLFGMTGIPGIDCAFQARRGVPVALADTDPERLEAVATWWKDLELGVPAETAELSWPDAGGWAAQLPRGYDLVVSFAALWWCPDPWAALAAQCAVAGKAVLVAQCNATPAMALRERLWHHDMFAHLWREALDTQQVAAHAATLGWQVAERGWFDFPPFPDTALPLRQALRALQRAKGSPPEDVPDGTAREGFWRWSIAPYLRGEQPDLPARMHRLAALERAVPERVKARGAHHSYLLLTRA